jgi:hypothetical protein
MKKYIIYLIIYIYTYQTMIKYGKIFIIHKYDTISLYDYYIGNPIYELEYSINESTNIIIVFEKENSNDNNIYDN